MSAPEAATRHDECGQSKPGGAFFMETQIEAVARALYAAEDDAQTWECEPEIIKEEFRDLAQTALALLARHCIRERYDMRTFAFPYAA
jgi:hypothetical protein